MAEQSAARVAADSLGLHVLREIVDQFMQLPGFANLTAAQQQVHIERLDKTVRQLVAEALGVIFSAEYPAVTATLGRISIGKGIAGAFDVDRTAESRHELMDRAGQKVVIVMADPDRYYQRMTDVKASADQRDLFHDPNQPLGHMGVENPPDPNPPDDGGGAGGDSGLDDALPEAGEETPVELLTPEQVCEMLAAFDVVVPLEVAAEWPESTLQDAAVWAIALRQRAASGDAPPESPEFLRAYITIPSVEVITGDGSGEALPPVNEDGTVGKSPMEIAREALSLEPIEIPDAAIDAEIVAGLKLRGITLKAKAVRNWSQSQRVAAISWLQSRSTHRPEFIPAPEAKESA